MWVTLESQTDVSPHPTDFEIESLPWFHLVLYEIWTDLKGKITDNLVEHFQESFL